MKLPELCIKKPVLALVMSLVLIVLGVVAFLRMDVRFFPEVQLPVVTVSTSFSGAAPRLMESQVTTPIENAIAGVPGIKYMSSSSGNGSSRITVMFNIGSDFESEASQVRSKVAGVMENLPAGINAPVVSTGVNGSAVINYAITQKGKTSAQIRNYINTKVVPLFTQLKGVGSVYVNGAWDYAMRIWLNAGKMAALNVSVTDVENALNANNIYFPAGSFYGSAKTYGVVSRTQLTNPSQFSNIIIRSDSSGTVRLSDIAKVEQGYTTPFPTPLYIDGKQGVVLNVAPLQGVNPITVANEVKKEMKLIHPSLPNGMSVKVIYDKSTYLKASIDETLETIAEAVVLVILVVFLFLGSIRASLIPIVTIPVSMITVFFILYLLGFSINTMSLLGMVLAIGLVVDDAIVMLENIHRHLEAGMSPYRAALKGSSEIMFAVLAMSITLVAVYAPIGLAQGFTAKLFQQFAFTLAGAIVISAFVALSLSPMMCSRILLPHSSEKGYTLFLERTFHRLMLWYQHVLRAAIKMRHFIVLILIVIAGIGYWLFSDFPSEFIPADDYGQIAMSIKAPSGSTFQYVGRYLNQIEGMVQKIPAIQSFGYQLLNGGMLSFFTLKPWQDRKQSVQQIVAQLNQEFKAIPGLTVTASVPDVIQYGVQGSGFQVDLMTSRDYKDLLPAINKFVTIMKNYPGVYNVNTNLRFDSEEYGLTINRDLAAAEGVNIQDIANTVQAMMSGEHWTNVDSNNATYQVLVQMRKQDMLGFGGLDKIYVPRTSTTTSTTTSTPSVGAITDTMVPLSSLIKLKPTVLQNSLDHYNRLRAGSITASVSPGYTMSQVIAYAQQHLPQVLSPSISYAFVGKANQFLSNSGSMVQIFILSFIFIYLILAAQFGSFIDPFIILLAVPLSMVGAMIFLWLYGGTLNLYSEIGLVTLVGLISKHGILITQFINDKRREGKELIDAILEGSAIRLRPVLMTTAAMVFGALPLALAVGPGSNGRGQIGWVVVGGLLCGTFFSLIVVPVAYYYLGRFKKFNQHPEEQDD